MEQLPLSDAVLKLVHSADFRPCKPKTIAKILELPSDDYPALRRLLKELVAEGFLAYGANHHIGPTGGGESSSKRASSKRSSSARSSAKQSSSAEPADDGPTADADTDTDAEGDIDPKASPLHDLDPRGGERPKRKRSRRGEGGDGLEPAHNRKPDDVKPDDVKPDGPKPDGPKPDGRKPEGRKPDDGKPDDGRLAKSKPDKSKPDDRKQDRKQRGGRQAPGPIRGTFRSAAGGYGFVRPLNPDQLDNPDDIFIPARFVSSAMDGDLVDVQLGASRGPYGQGREGSIAEVVQRGRRKFAGTFKQVGGEAVAWLDGVNLDHPVSLGDIRGLPLTEDDKVLVELVRYPETSASGHYMPGEAVILEVLGSSKNPSVDTIAVLHQFDLPEEFPEAALEAAREVADGFDDSNFTGRTDVTQVPTLTIDPVDARDFDDAISLSKNDAGNWELMVHIADVSYFVPPGTALDKEAQDRATSVYLPDRVIPMLPEIISNSLASLQPDKRRYAKTAMIEFDPDGRVVHSEFFAAVIRNQRRFTYEEVDKFLADRNSVEAPEVIKRLLEDMHELAMILRQRRMDRGSIELNLPEVKIDLDRTGKVRGAYLVEYTDSHKMVEEFMLAANQAVATFLTKKDLPFLRRAHSPPQAIKLKRLNEFLRSLGLKAGDMASRFEVQKVIDSVKGTRLQQAVNFAILKSMSKAVYQPQPERHFALDMTNYCHFTSPIRRYPDLVVHRILQDVIDGRDARRPVPVLTRLGQHCSDKEVNAEAAERVLIRVKLLHYMNKLLGQSFTGTITAVKSDRIVVQLHSVPVEGVLRHHTLPADRYRFDRDTHSFEGHGRGNRFRLGDAVSVKVASVDLPRRELFFDYEGRAEHSLPAPKPRGKGRRGGEDDRDEDDSRGSDVHRVAEDTRSRDDERAAKPPRPARRKRSEVSAESDVSPHRNATPERDDSAAEDLSVEREAAFGDGEPGTFGGPRHKKSGGGKSGNAGGKGKSSKGKRRS